MSKPEASNIEKRKFASRVYLERRLVSRVGKLDALQPLEDLLVRVLHLPGGMDNQLHGAVRRAQVKVAMGGTKRRRNLGTRRTP